MHLNCAQLGAQPYFIQVWEGCYIVITTLAHLNCIFKSKRPLVLRTMTVANPFISIIVVGTNMRIMELGDPTCSERSGSLPREVAARFTLPSCDGELFCASLGILLFLCIQTHCYCCKLNSR